LPYYRGAAPIQRSIINGETVTGITIQHMALKMDAGDIIRTAAVDIPLTMSAGELEAALLEKTKPLLVEVIKDFMLGQVTQVPQDHSKVTFAPKLELEEGELRFEQKSAQTLHNLVRGFSPHPGAWCWVEIKGEKKRLKINRTLPHETNPNDKRKLIIHCSIGFLELIDVKLEGKKSMSGEEFQRGYSPAFPAVENDSGNA